ncbi:MAG: hypothetical protein ACR2OG_04070, partial [Gemmatimonadaceae bacterium]
PCATNRCPAAPPPLPPPPPPPPPRSPAPPPPARRARLGRMAYARAAAVVAFLAAGTVAIARVSSLERQRASMPSAGRLASAGSPVAPRVATQPADVSAKMATGTSNATSFVPAAPPVIAAAPPQRGTRSERQTVAVARSEKAVAPVPSSALSDAAKSSTAPSVLAQSAAVAQPATSPAPIGRISSGVAASGATVAARLRADEIGARAMPAPLLRERRSDTETVARVAERTLEGVPAADEPQVVSEPSLDAPSRLIRRRRFALRPGVVIVLEAESATGPSLKSAPSMQRERVSDEVAADSIVSEGGVVRVIRWIDEAGVRITLSGPVSRDELLALRKKVR